MKLRAKFSGSDLKIIEAALRAYLDDSYPLAQEAEQARSILLKIDLLSRY